MKKHLKLFTLGLGVLLTLTLSMLLALALAKDTKDSPSLYASQNQEPPDDPGVSALGPPSTAWTESRDPVDAPLRGDPSARTGLTYDNVINQFEVEENPRYEPRDNFTFCNTFVWDVTRAMGAEIPYWVGEDGEPSEMRFASHGWEVRVPTRGMSASDMDRWLNGYGSRKGWREVTAEEAQELASLGHPAVVSVDDLYGGEGHIGIVRPGRMLDGPALAQAGTRNVEHGYVYDLFPREGTQFFVNDTGTSVERL